MIYDNLCREVIDNENEKRWHEINPLIPCECPKHMVIKPGHKITVDCPAHGIITIYGPQEIYC